ncbi:unnamed protein product [Discula destructiva]
MHGKAAGAGDGSHIEINGDGDGDGNGDGLTMANSFSQNVVDDVSAAASASAPASASASSSAAPLPVKTTSPLPQTISNLGASAFKSAAIPSLSSHNANPRPSSNGDSTHRPPQAQQAQPSPSPSVAPNANSGRWTLPSSTSTKTITQPPANRLPHGFPSPGREAMHPNRQFVDDRNVVNASIQQSVPEAVRRCVRDNWEKCLTGSDFHQAFVLNASIHHASPPAIQRGIRDFGKGLIAAAKSQIVDQMTTADLDQLMPLILSKASVAFFDKVLEMRLKTIDAKSLINALARAERLGYEPSDVQDDDNNNNGDNHGVGQPSVSHHCHSQLQSAPAATPAPTLPSAPPAIAHRSAPVLHCGICFRRFPAQSAFDYHTKMKICTRLPNTPGAFKYNCQHCGQGFTTPMGLQYHNASHVCGDFGEPAKSFNHNQRTSSPASAPTAASAHIPANSTPVASPRVHASADAQRNPGRTDSDGALADPYAHLSPEQLAAMQAELRDAEIKMGERMRQANMLPDAAEKKTKLEGLSNSFGTKQSLIRKKYGVRLRNRRTKTEIQQERERIAYRTSAELQADVVGAAGRGPGRQLASNSHRATSSSAASTPANGNSNDNARASVNQTSPVVLQANINVRNGKRRFSGSHESTAAKRLAYTDTSGLGGGGVKAEAETKNTTFPPKELSLAPSGAGTKDEPVALDDSSSEAEESGSDDSDDGTDEDIPAVLPPSVMQTLQRSSSVAGSGSRPGSSSGAAATSS